VDFGRNSVERALQDRDAHRSKLKNLISLTAVRVVLMLLLLIAAIAVSFVLGAIRGIVDSAPELKPDSIAPMANFYKIPAEQILVISDEISLSPGSIRIRKKGSAGGHNGLKSIIARLGTEDFPRIRLGVGEKKEKEDLAAHVLGRFEKEDEKRMEEAYTEAAKACICTVTEGIEKAMNLYNKKI